MISPRSHRPQRAAFSLVEVTLALGIVAFALVALVGVFGNVIQQRGETRARKEVFNAIGALQNKLSEPEMFGTAYQWVRSGTAELVYARYRADASGAPDASGSHYRADWVHGAVPPAILAAVDGRWIKAKIVWDDRSSVNQLTRSQLPAAVDDYPSAFAMLRADIYTVPTPTATVVRHKPSAANIALSIHR